MCLTKTPLYSGVLIVPIYFELSLTGSFELILAGFIVGDTAGVFVSDDVNGDLPFCNAVTAAERV